jgi:hypothetical protein
VCGCTIISPICADRLKSTQQLLPEVLQTKPRLDSCPGCDEADLQDVCTPCHAFWSLDITLTNICEQKCGRCGYQTEYDGGEDFHLRTCWFKSQLHGSYKICFHWGLLYDTILQLVEVVHWYSTWLRQMAYQRAGTSEVELMSLQSVYKHFSEACIDFECLWAVDYRDVLRCQCARPGSMRVADVIKNPCKFALMRMYAP